MKSVVPEHKVEAALVRRVTAAGGVAVKMMAVRGLPDRLVLLPGGRTVFVELKRPKGGRLSPHQKFWIARLQALGVEVAVARNGDDIDALFGLEAAKGGKHGLR